MAPEYEIPYNFHVMIYDFPYDFSQPFKNVKTICSSPAIQNQVAVCGPLDLAHGP